MATREGYALLSANVYGNSQDVRDPRNVLPVPDYWTSLDVPPIGSTSTGFMAREGLHKSSRGVLGKGVRR
jgi:hypothetical protein